MRFTSSLAFIAALTLANLSSTFAMLPIQVGKYGIVSQRTATFLQAADNSTALFAFSTDIPPPYPTIFTLIPGIEGGFTLKLEGLGGEYVTRHANEETSVGYVVGPGWAALDWGISPAGDETYVIKVIDRDVVWTADPPGGPISQIILAPVTGQKAQTFMFVKYPFESQ
ncbi:uncharacterized protein LACBIDRAFT_330823 [Laccaria bicolor S238N-H82]|uniref:Predicted protein n=1 Tax=Laccaria bicolor (strain S238N-H82 / ATCC MYA-4686) TaxID=486041 RepID=B0DML1_LACBS|nr:uncharacterized protein LACBIDRAFT_330823 [Laccaria bicolor S238N-H82]EDR04207.1 predicted protein [Laccaria bicolor S238N-H82]|eukprot:XP_001885098.1 predicted protein [Laccaria bicolor S238N-H82]